jgi:hypothetical protein
METTFPEESSMKQYFVRFFAISVYVGIACLGAHAQNDALTAAAGSRYVISAKAGGVNFVEGTVGVVRRGRKSGVLHKGDTLQIGDRVSTGADGKAEILLNPGSFLRLGGNAAFEFKTTSLDDLQLTIDRGSAILEVFAAEEFKVEIATPGTKYLLIDTGIYRVDITNSGESRLEVWKGSAKAGNSLSRVKAGRAATSGTAGSVTVAKFDRDDKDDLDIWSKTRGKELAKSTATLKRANMRTALMQSFLGRRWNVFNSFGLWVSDPMSGGYCFLPFGRGWYSPYGYGYGHYLGWYDLPPVIWYPPHSGGGSTGGGGTPTNPPIGPHGGPRGPIPPFVRMQQNAGGGIRGGDISGSSYDPPVYSSSSSGSSSSSAPAPVKVDPGPPTKQP